MVALTTAQRAGLVDQVIEQLRAGIGSGEWPVGQRIPTEPELVAQLGVGRNTVREAVRALAHTGILEVRQGDGTYVRATSEMAGAIRRLCGPELREVLQVRRALEVDGARLAATARTEADLAELRRLLDRRDAAWDKLSRSVDEKPAGEDPPDSTGAADHRSSKGGASGAAGHSADASRDEFARADSEFHSAVVRSGHNRLLFQMYQGLMEAITASVATTAALPDQHPLPDRHALPDRQALPDDQALPYHHARPDAAQVRQVEQLRHRGLVAAIADSDPDRAAAEAARFLDELLALVGP